MPYSRSGWMHEISGNRNQNTLYHTHIVRQFADLYNKRFKSQVTEMKRLILCFLTELKS